MRRHRRRRPDRLALRLNRRRGVFLRPAAPRYAASRIRHDGQHQMARSDGRARRLH
jgi:hypothetical protein